MDKLVSPFQSSFIPGRQASYNIIISQEILHSIQRMTGKFEGMTLKDLEKAYDQVRWEFLHKVLFEVGIPDLLIKLIMNCVSSANMTILGMENRQNLSKPIEGCAKGTPYLLTYSYFVWRSCLTPSWVRFRDRNWKPIPSIKGGPAMSHLRFADDIIVFGEASLRQDRVIYQIVEDFCLATGKRVSLMKSKLFLSKNVRRETARGISTRCQTPTINDLGKYLKCL